MAKIKNKEIVQGKDFNNALVYLNDSDLSTFGVEERMRIILFVKDVKEAQDPLADFMRKTFLKYQTGTKDNGEPFIESYSENNTLYNKEVDEILSKESEIDDLSDIEVPIDIIGSVSTSIAIGLFKIFKQPSI